MIRQLIAAGWTFAISLGVCLAGPALADEGDIKARELVSEARFTIERLVADEAVGPDVRPLFDNAKAIMIFPSNIKAGFLLAGEGGGGILMARADNNEWSYPAFYTMGTGSVGLQIGALESETVIFIMTGEGLEVLLDGTATFGGELNAAAGSVASSAVI